jgi:hypothetical protein
LALAILIFATGCATLSGRPFGQYVDDKTISAKVKLRLASRLHPTTLTRVHVDTYEGTVYLSGVADSEEMKMRVERIAAHVDDVQQVVNNLSTKQPAAPLGASADTSDASAGSTQLAAASPGVLGTSGLLETLSGVTDQLRGILRYQADGGLAGPYTGYDENGRLVVTLYLVPMRGLAQKGAEDFGSGGRRIDHVSIFPIDVQPDVPEARYAIVLWHVSPAEAAALR